MSQFSIFNPLGWFAPRAPIIAPAAPAPDKTPGSTPLTAAQSSYGGGLGIPGGSFTGLPVSINGAVLGYQGGATPWVQPPRYWHGTYRLMRLHPTLTITRGAVLDPIRANKWLVVGKDKDVDEDWIKFVADQVLPQRTTVINHALTAPEFGSASFEKRWKVVDGERIITLFPLKVEWTTIYTTPTGEFAGVINMPSSTGIVSTPFMANDLLGPQYSLVISHDMDAGNLCGQSRYEAAYDAWCDWQWTRLDMARLRGKLSSIIPMLKYPAGTTMLNGIDVDNSVVAQRILNNLTDGRGVAMPSVDFGTDAIQENPKLASTSLWELTFYDAGTYTAAQSGMIENEKYQDTLMAYAWKVRPQQIFDAQNGTKAQAGTHTDSASVDPEQLDAEIAEQLNRQWVDDILLHNFGPKAVGQVFIKPQPLSNPTVDFKQQVVTALFAANDPEAQSNLDTKTLMGETELPVLDTPKPIPAPVDPQAKSGEKPSPEQKPQGLSMAMSMLDRWESGELLALPTVLELSAPEELTGGEWRTINGAHVYMKDGVAVAGPEHLIGKKESQIHAVHENHIKSVRMNPEEPIDVDSRSFRDWFEGSEAINRSGDPLKVYHGSPKENILDFTHGNSGGVFFTSSEPSAKDFAKRGGTDGRVYQGYLSVKNPLDLRSHGQDVSGTIAMRDALIEKGMDHKSASKLFQFNQDDPDPETSSIWWFVRKPEISREIQKYFDGVFFEDYGTPLNPSTKFKSYVVFSNSQIKVSPHGQRDAKPE